MIPPIIVAVDPRRDDPAPLALGLRLARLTGARLLLASVFPMQRTDRIHPELADALHNDAQNALMRARDQLADAPGPTPDIRLLVTGAESPASALHQLVIDEAALMLVLGSSERGQLGRVSPGAVTDRVLHGAPCAVAVAPRGLTLAAVAEPMLRVSAAYVDAPDGQEALEAAAAIAGAAQAHLRVLVVTRPGDFYATATPAIPQLDHEKARRDDAEHELKHGLQASGDGSATGEVLAGDTAAALAAAASNHDLLVCGSRGFGPLRTVILGGTSHALVRRATCPVLVVPRGTAEPITAALRAAATGGVRGFEPYKPALETRV
jgi:nucleotide-binding universal stress UspA family protein